MPGKLPGDLKTAMKSFSDVIIAVVLVASIFLAMFVEGIFTPIPSELIMPLAGYLASIGEFSLVLVILVGSLGAVCGSTIAAW